MEDGRGKDRLRFLTALAVFFLWVATLCVMATLSGHKPVEKSGSSSAR